MHFIEALLHIEPDGGNGSLEMAIALAAGALVAIRTRRVVRRIGRVTRRTSHSG